jgi:methylenetetrahydrofolate reductase (NADPH)
VKITDHILKAKKTLFSFEIIPPKKGNSIQELYDNIDPLMEFNPPFIDVTTSREQFVYVEKDRGLLERKTTRTRPGTLGICASIKHKYDVDTVPHVLCGGFTKEETEYLLVDCHYLGIDNVMALRGDAMSHQKYFEPTAGGHHYAKDLVSQIHDLSSGKYLHNIIETDYKSDFCIGVAGYPEKHLESPSPQTDLKHLKEKVDAGADYIVTQMFFDNQKYFDFVKLCRDNDINVPIIPGLKPLSTAKHLNILPHRFHLNLPSELVNEVLRCKNREDIREVGVEWAVQQTKELVSFGAPCVHYYTMGNTDNIIKIMSNFC